MISLRCARSSVQIVLLAILLLPSTTAAQFALGPLGGFNLANVKGSPQDYSSRQGITGGAMMVAKVTNWLAVQPEFYYAQKGAEDGTTMELSNPLPSDTSASKLRLDYFEVPILFRLTTGGQNARIYVMGGPAVAARLACTVELSTASNTVEQSGDCTDRQGRDLVRSMDYSWVGGLGIDFRVGGSEYDEDTEDSRTSTTTLDFRVINGWQSLSETGPDFLQALKNRTFAFSVRYPLGRH
jgi:hypothetical protein